MAFANVNEISNDRLEELLLNMRERAAAWQQQQLHVSLFWTTTSNVFSGFSVHSPYLGALIFLGAQYHRTIDLLSITQIQLMAAMIEVIHHIHNLHYQRFWPLIGPSFTVHEICNMLNIPRFAPDGTLLTPTQRMVIFYQRAGFPNLVTQEIQRYENNQMTRSALANFMHLNQEHLTDVIGTGWDAASEMRRDLIANNSVSVPMSEIYSLLQEYSAFISTLDEEEYEELLELIEFFEAQNLSVEETVEFVDYIFDYLDRR